MVLPLIPILIVAGIVAASAGAGTVAVANAETAKANTETVKAGGTLPGSGLFDIFGGSAGSSDFTGMLPLALVCGGGLIAAMAVMK